MMGQTKFKSMISFRIFSHFFMGYFSALSYGFCFLREYIRGGSFTDIVVVI